MLYKLKSCFAGKKQLFVTATLSVLAFTSCRKDGPNNIPSPRPSLQIAATVEIIVGGLPANLVKQFVYDEQDRLKEIRFASPNAAIVEKYIYTGNKVHYRYYAGTTEVPNNTTDYILNGDGKAEATLYPNATFFRTSEYNNAGYVTRINFTNGQDRRFKLYHYSAGNVLDSISESYENGTKIEVTVFEYETGKKNTIGFGNKGIHFLGEAQAAPVKKSTVFSFQRSGLGGIRSKLSETNYTYEYDEHNRIGKYSAVETGYPLTGPPVSAVKEVMEYTYRQ